ncbi:hypothetical protein [Jiangella asiatica]|uniref:Uncharacterized protein n=1 Tax=Jiangella asiatica TaxID=2530372 RepID=A0A4R5DLC0_9ACTN|nr:hypothetical protein [Jiangella asiatica]TDE15026.1 hypothetical protein E1269_02660 [Jiangella asiatica]
MMESKSPVPVRRRRRDASAPARAATAAVGLLCAVAGGVAAGGPGVVGGVLATVLVVAFFWSGLMPLALTERLSRGPLAAVGLLLLTYWVRLAAVLLTLYVAAELDVVDRRWTGMTLVACTLAFTVVYAVLTIRANAGSRPVARPSAPPPAHDGP